MPLITCNSLVLGYDSRRVIEDISFSVIPGDYLVIVGENGSGKSTLIKALLGSTALFRVRSNTPTGFVPTR